MRGWHSNMLQVPRAESCTWHATWKGLASKCRRCHAKWEVLSPQGRLTLQSAENIANTIPRKSLLPFLCFLALMVSSVFAKLQGLLVFIPLQQRLQLNYKNHCNRNSTKNKNPHLTEQLTTNNRRQLANSMPNGNFQIQHVSSTWTYPTDEQNARFQLANAATSKQNGRI